MSDEPSSTRLSYGRSVLVSVAAVGVMSLMALANNIVIARSAGPDGRGLYGVAVAIGALALPFASAGLGAASTWQLGREQPYAQLLSLARRVCLVSLGVGLLAAGLAWLGFGLGLDELTLWAVIAAALALPAQTTVEITRGFLLGQRRAIAYNVTSTAVVATLLVLNLIAAAMITSGDLWVLTNLVLANWVMALFVTVMSFRRPSARPEPGLVRSSLTYGMRSAAVALGDAALLRIDYLVAAPFVSLASLGIYAVADQISHLMAWVGLLAGKMLLPEAASDSADGRRSLATLALACRVIVAMTVVGAGIAIWLGPWLINLLFGAPFADAYLGLLILLPATLFKSQYALISTWLQGRGDQRPVVRASVIAVAAEIVAVAVLAYGYGWLGMAVAKAGAYGVQLGLSLFALRAHRVRLAHDDTRSAPGGLWLLRPRDVAALRAALSERRARTARREVPPPDGHA